MPYSFREQIPRRLWPTEDRRDVWAMVDGARDSRIYGHVLNSYLESCCLFSGELSRELEIAAPYLIRLERDDRVARQIIEEGWGESWGVFCKCDTSMEKLRRHLRGLLLVRDPAGKRVGFRYYDPRVLRVYLPTCAVEELQTVFGPIAAFWTESGNPSHMLEFRFERRTLVQNKIPLEFAAAAQSG